MSEPLTYVQERDRKYTANVHFIITLFNVDMFVIYQLNFTIFI